jgi:hypothetical protein
MTERSEPTETQPAGTETMPTAEESPVETPTAAASRPPLPSMNLRGTLGSIGRSLVINGLVPLLIYNLVKSRGAPDITALGIAAVVPAIDGLVTVMRQRRVDLISALVLIGIAVSIVAVLIGGDPRLLLIRESFLTAALGVACFVSFFLPRPLMFYFGRYFATADDPTKAAHFNAMWQYPYFRQVMQVITLVWGVAYVGEFVLRVVLVYRLTINQVLAISPVVFNAITIGVVLWTFAYARHARQRGEEMRRQQAIEAAAASSE